MYKLINILCVSHDSTKMSKIVKIKCVVVGDESIGIPHLLFVCNSGKYPEGRDSFLFENFSTLIVCDGHPVNVDLWSVSSEEKEDYSKLRPLTYTETDIFVLCFSVVNHSSFKNVTLKWHPELRNYAPNAPILLIGTQSELRQDKAKVAVLAEKKLSPISKKQGQQLAIQIGAVKYMECSSINEPEIKEIFDEAVRNVIYGSLQHQNCECSVM